MSYTPYQKKNPGDVLKLQDWLEIQQRIKEELRDHRHGGNVDDGELPTEDIGPRLTSFAFESGAVTTGKLASDAVGELALAPSVVHGYHINPDIRLSESLFFFRKDGGHDHDGIRSRQLPVDVVAIRQLQDGVIGEFHLEGAPSDNDLSAEELTYARGRAFTPGNVLRAARQLIEHVKMDMRTLLLPGDYVATSGTSLIVRGLQMDNLDDGNSQDGELSVAFKGPGVDMLTEPAQVLDVGSARARVPDMGSQNTIGHLFLVRGAGTNSLPWLPITNAVRFTYKPGEN